MADACLLLDSRMLMEELFEIIKERPDHNLGRRTICPGCHSGDIEEKEHTTTLVGGKPDPNHHWVRSHCNDCGKDFTHEFKEGNHWYTQHIEGRGKIVLKGMPS